MDSTCKVLIFPLTAYAFQAKHVKAFRQREDKKLFKVNKQLDIVIVIMLIDKKGLLESGKAAEPRMKSSKSTGFGLATILLKWHVKKEIDALSCGEETLPIEMLGERMLLLGIGQFHLLLNYLTTSSRRIRSNFFLNWITVGMQN
ncbi:hypothetical protein B9Z55_027948 [Caenorhabditis nigoni]|uniref:Uncharacterized protein n=1 Tax=Caenorhabditis nigoni TaxID=1611254 RepID=A0A2G5SDU8_9PELO|nr:hypothetical protein B9Z55_027948 [Caenorhabditis nigoni]